jgi:hypothetical protein
MTDHPRFEPIRGAPDEAHLEYNGGRLVDAVLKLIDWRLAPREPAPPSARGHQGDGNRNMRGRRMGLSRSHSMEETFKSLEHQRS